MIANSPAMHHPRSKPPASSPPSRSSSSSSSIRARAAFLALVLALTLAAAAVATGASLTALEVVPARVELRGPFAQQRVVVIGRRADGSSVDLTARVELASETPAVAGTGAIDDETRPAINATGNGDGLVRVSWEGLEARVPVTVSGFDTATPPSFAHDVVSGLTRAGCNGGSCHGAQHGRGGFKLSLLGYEPDVDERAIVHDAFGRRVSRSDPAQSLLLRKPLGRLPHEGGVRIVPGSTFHRTLARWVEAGAPGPRPDEPVVESIDVFPDAGVLAVDEPAHLLVTARLSDGSTEDVTGKVLLGSLNDGVATVDDEARVVARSPGETAVMVRYQGQAAVSRVTVPYRRLEDHGELAAFEASGGIDEIVASKWKTLGLLPSELASDGEFIRRVFLVAIGTLPTPAEVRRFLDDPDAGKREKLIDAVLERPEYVDYWALKWGDILRIDRNTMNEKGMWSMYNWLRSELRENRPLDAMVRALITAQGSTYTSGPTNYYRVARRPNDLAETTTQVFLGVRLQCAQCHHHPFEKWTQEDYYGMAAFFARLGVKRSSEFGVYGREEIVHVKSSGDVRHPKTGKVVPPTPLDAEPVDDAADRRRALAGWLTSPDNRLFARNLANRLWGYVMGRGIVEPIDDMRVTNPPTMPRLLEALADELIGSGFDQKQLLRTIMRSRIFQLSSRERPENAGDEVFHSRFLVRRLPAEVLLDALVHVTGVPESFSGLPAGTRAIQLPDARFDSYFLESFGKPKRAIACECERVSRPNMAQALHLINGEFIEKRLGKKGGRVQRAIDEGLDDAAVIEDFYLAAFSRRPTAAELEKVTRFVAAAPSKKEGLEDILWALCNASEFLFNH